MFICLECGRKFRTVKAAERAANDGCPKCGGVDVDLDVNLDVPLPGAPTKADCVHPANRHRM